MSWSINATSRDRIALRTAVEAEEHMPPQLRELLVQHLNGMKCPDDFAIAVRSLGHYDEHYCYGDFKVELTRAV